MIKQGTRCALFVLFMWLSIGGAVMGYSPFTELARDHWSYDAVEKLLALGLIDENASNFYQLGYSVSRYEMAMWVASAFQVMSDGEEALVQAPQAYQLEAMVASYNKRNPEAKISASDIATLRNLVVFLEEELNELGYSVAVEEQKQASKSVALAAMNALTASGNDTAKTMSALHVDKVSAAGAKTSSPASLWDTSSKFTKPETTSLPELGFTLDLGDLSLSAGKKVNIDSATYSVANTLGLTYRLQKVNVQVGYASEVAPRTNNESVGGWRSASAGVQYALAPASRAEAGLLLSANPEARTTTADFGLRYQQDDASVSLGYRLVDLSGDHLQGITETHNNVATAEFSIRF